MSTYPSLAPALMLKYILFIALSLNTVFSFAQSLNRYEYSAYQMGTTFRLVFYAPADTLADIASKAAFERIAALNQIFSDYDPNSEVSQLSELAGSGQAIEVSDELWEVLNYAQKVSRKSKGAFDVSIGALSKLWRKAFRQQVFPKQADIEQAKTSVNYKAIKLYTKSQKVALTLKGMRLDFGGIAKGYAVDEAMKVLASRGIQSALVDGGGDILVTNAPPNKAGWQITTEKDTAQLLTNTAIATSGDRYRFLEHEGIRYSHIVHPKTGLGTMDKKQVTITANTCMKADALASACVVLKEKQGKKLARKMGASIRYE